MFRLKTARAIKTKEQRNDTPTKWIWQVGNQTAAPLNPERGPLMVMTNNGSNTTSVCDWNAYREQIYATLNLKQEAELLGVRFVSSEPSSEGWLTCRAIDREDRNPSAGFNVQTGVYVDHGSNEERLSLFDLAVRLSNFSDWKEAQNHYAEKANVTLPTIQANAKSKQQLGPVDQVYDYRDETGKLIFQVVRHQHPKTFRQRRPNPKGGWFSNLQGVAKPLYCLPELLASGSDEVVYLVEGEKDANNLQALGLVATTNAGGAGKWEPQYTDALTDRHVVLIPDHDEQGEKHVQTVGTQLQNKVASLRVLRLPDLKEKEDVSDWLSAGNTKDQLTELTKSATEWVADEKTIEVKQPKQIANVEIVQTNNHKESKPHSMNHIIETIYEVTNGWPRRVNKTLFVHEPAKRVNHIENSAALFGYLGSVADKPSKFSKQDGCHTKEEVFKELQRTATEYKGIENVPHEPRLDNHYYTCEFPQYGEGKYLRGLVERFSPETEIDRDFILAFFVTLFWGGPGGTRPAFLITADAGRGVGKTTLATMGGYLVGGHLDGSGVIEFSSREDSQSIKSRLLSPEGYGKRVALLDNVKTSRFSSAELEALITAQSISGKQMYVGDATRPNLLTYVITLNGASLSKDLAQRCVIVKLKKPTHSGNWVEETRKYIDDHRTEIIADCLGFFQQEKYPLEKFSRWGFWEREVLSRVPEPQAAQLVMSERQNVVDAEAEEAEIIEEEFARHLQQLNYDTKHEIIFIPSRIVCKWYGEAIGEKPSPQKATRALNQKIKAEELKQLEVSNSRSYGRGFLWKGANASFETQINTDLETRLEHFEQRTFHHC